MSTVQTIELHQVSDTHRQPRDLGPEPAHAVPSAGAACHQISGIEPPASVTVTPAPSRVRVFSAIEPVITSHVSQTTRFAIISLLVTANLIQFISNFITLSGGLTLSQVLGRNVESGQANWMAASYSLTQGAFVLVSGRLGAIYGHQRLSLIGLLLFAVFSLINGFCKSFEAFIAVRALSGVGGGIFMPNAVTVLALMAPPGRARNVLLGLFAASPPAGGVIGALLAGLCANSGEFWTWTVLFGCIAASSTVCLVLLFFMMPHERPVDKDGKIDFVGTCLGLSSLIIYNVAWNQAPSVGWATPYEIAILISSLVLFASFLLWERFYASDPIMPMIIFKAPTFSAIILVVLFSYMAFGIALWYAISWQQVLRHISVFQIGVNFVPFGIGALAAVGLAAYLLPRVAAKWVMAIGVGVILAASLLLATMPINQSYWPQTFPAMILCGFCPDFVYLAAQVIASNSVGRKYQGVASSLVGTLNLYGVSLGLGFAGTIETEVTKSFLSSGASGNREGVVAGFRAALYFSAALAVVGLLLNFAFVRLPKAEREGWEEEDEQEQSEVAVTVEAQALRRNVRGSA